MPRHHVPRSYATAGDDATGRARRTERDAALGDAPVNWDDFDSDVYFAENYASLRDDDRRFLKRIGGFFAEVAAAGDFRPGRGVDVGSGTNLYPALAMLPLCERIELWEPGKRNQDWLSQQLPAFSPSWDPYWEVLAEQPEYRELVGDGAAARKLLGQRAELVKGSLFDLPKREFDVGTMFFVAESRTDRIAEFTRAVHRFTGALRPGAPFAAAFMRKSDGYSVDGHFFPAVWIDERDIEACLSDVVKELDWSSWEIVNAFGQRMSPGGDALDGSAEAVGEPLRPGYDGMILVTGGIQ